MKLIHKILTKMMFVLFFVSIVMMDSKAIWVPVTCFLVSGAWLVIYAYKKGWWGSTGEGDNDVSNK